MSEQNESHPPRIRIVYRADGTAEVNGVAVRVDPGRDVRDAAYAAAVALIAQAPGPVVALSIEPDGTAYPLTLYPGRTVLGIDESVPADRRDRWIPGGGLLPRRIATMPSRLPVLRLGWLLTAVIGCVVVAAMAAVLLHRDESSVVRLSIEQQNGSLGSAAPQAAEPPAIVPVTTAGKALGGLASRVAAEISRQPKGSPSAPGPAGHGIPATAGTGTASTGSASAGSSQDSGGQTGPTRTSRPDPTSAGTFTVGEVTLVLIGGDKKDPSLTYVITVSANGTKPVTLTYTYSGSGNGAAVTRSTTLSGETDYAVTGQLPARSYCGQTVTMRVSTSPASDTGTAVAATTPGC